MSHNRETELSQPSGNLMEVLAFTAEQTRRLADANGVMGQPLTVDGVTVIPVSKVSVGFAGGGADIRSESKKRTQTPAGAGAKVTLTPVTFLAIEDGHVRKITVEAEQGSLITDLAKTAVDQFKRLKNQK